MKQEEPIAVTGASGFVGRALIRELLASGFTRIVALSRSRPHDLDPRVEWRRVDLFDESQITGALSGIKSAYYLVHSMLPSAGLDQGRFEDFDLYLAENFINAADRNDTKHIVYLGGLCPERDDNLSKHLESRLEVEQVLGSGKSMLTVIRAGLILGAGGSSFQILERLVRRLPILICPKWTQSKMTPVHIDDVARALVKAVHFPFAGEASAPRTHRSFDVGGSSTHSYRELMEVMALKLRLRRVFVSIPFSMIAFSRLWVRLFASSSRELVYPLLESLRHQMVVSKNRLFPFNEAPKSYGEAIDSILASTKMTNYRPHRFHHRAVRSIQRLSLPASSLTAGSVANAYVNWLPRFLRPLIHVTRFKDQVNFCLVFKVWRALQLKFCKERSHEHLSVFEITGGYLVKRKNQGRLEFRITRDRKYLMIAIHDFYPSLPWMIYRNTQAKVHVWVMKRFGQALLAGRAIALNEVWDNRH